MNNKDLYQKSLDLRIDVLNMIYQAKSGHIGGDYSAIDVLLYLYKNQMNVSPENVEDPARDKFILSKGHCVEALYAVLADCGFFPHDDLSKYFKFGSEFIGHPNNKINGIEMNSGALGHGLSVCVGMAISDKKNGYNSRVYTVMGDGELAEGSVWEAAESAAHYGLDNLCAVVDQNGLQISGTTDQVMSHGDLAKRFEAYGWNVIEVDGHDFDKLDNAFETAKEIKNKPTAIIAKTVKGKGVSFMENQVGWHHKVPSEQEYQSAINELNGSKEVLANE